MQSSCRNREKLRLRTASHSVRLKRCRELGGRPTLAGRSVAAPTPEDHPRGRAQTAGEDEAETDRPCRDRREIGAELALDIRCLAETLAERVGRVGQLLAFGLDLAANVLEGSAVSICHRSSAPPLSAAPRGSPAPESEASPF